MGRLSERSREFFLLPLLFLAMAGTGFAGKDQYLNLGIYSGLSSGSGEAFRKADRGRTGEDYYASGPVRGGYVNFEVNPRLSLQLDFNNQRVKNHWYYSGIDSAYEGTDSGNASTLILSSLFSSAPNRTAVFYFQCGGGLAFSSFGSSNNSDLELARVCVHVGAGAKFNLSQAHPLIRLHVGGAVTMVPGLGARFGAGFLRLISGIEFHLKTNQHQKGVP